MAAKVQIIFYLQSVKYLFFVKNKLFFREKMTIFAEKIDQSFQRRFFPFHLFYCSVSRESNIPLQPKFVTKMMKKSVFVCWKSL